MSEQSSSSGSVPVKGRKFGAGLMLICATIFIYRLILAHTFVTNPALAPEQQTFKAGYLFFYAFFPILIGLFLAGSDGLGVGAGMFFLLAVYDFLQGYIIPIDKQVLQLIDIKQIHRVLMGILLCLGVVMLLVYAIVYTLRKKNPKST
jgi:hypothetical protein